MRKVTAIILVFAMVILAVGMIAGAEETYSVGIYVPQQQMYVRTGPSQNYSHQDIIEPDTKVNVSVINGVWGWGTYGDGKDGWVMLTYMNKEGESSTTERPTETTTQASDGYKTGKYCVSDTELNVRVSPNSTIIGEIKNGDIVEVLEVSGIWGRIVWQNGFGWIYLPLCEYIDGSEETTTEAETTETETTTGTETTTESETTTEPVATTVPEESTTDGNNNENTDDYVTGLYEVDVPELYFRALPEADGEIIGITTAGTQMNVVAISGEWGRCAIDGKDGWLMLKYTKLIDAREYKYFFASINKTTLDGAVEVDFTKLADKGISGIILYLGFDNGLITFDPHFDAFYYGARDAGLKVGAIFECDTAVPATIKDTVQKVNDFLLTGEYIFELPVFCTISDTDSATLLDAANTFFDGLNENYIAGYKCSEADYEKIKNLENEHLWITDCGNTIDEGIAFAGFEYLVNAGDDSVGIELNLNITNKDYDVVHYYKEWTVNVAPTCDTFGEETAECIVCGQKRTRTIAPLGHTVTQWCESCDDPNYRIAKCDVCDKIVEKELCVKSGDSHDHFPEREKTLASKITCGVGRYVTRCRYCDIEMYESYDLVGDHEAGRVEVIEATCTQNGKILTHCKKCDVIFDTVEIAATGHEVDEWKVEKEPTETEDGTRIGLCKKCNKTIVETFNVTLIGDVNLDGKTKITDARAILRIALGLDEMPTGTAFYNADVNKDGKITLADAARTLRLAMGLV
ncbi:MAG TPA: SH3 domain-containing protein [Clostridiales bacterium]|nr:SH3 domain-containing protein [Clostridiales bacterium]